ncbi:hypothetical protein PF008_g11954 [Phytophthora fragariae]|uniref:Uncharacterized protein n=1 Tax=Phytophthora fragariae TaxID=53985 RepID=A0A6G0RQU6_9STRA|nr:hypothetical protein PF008_g11954 [Phytophthora fragariae]
MPSSSSPLLSSIHFSALCGTSSPLAILLRHPAVTAVFCLRFQIPRASEASLLACTSHQLNGRSLVCHRLFRHR